MFGTGTLGVDPYAPVVVYITKYVESEDVVAAPIEEIIIVVEETQQEAP